MILLNGVPLCPALGERAAIWFVSIIVRSWFFRHQALWCLPPGQHGESSEGLLQQQRPVGLDLGGARALVFESLRNIFKFLKNWKLVEEASALYYARHESSL